ncbi:integrator complex subunit 2 [Puma concolor]|uniref:Integrator complex subunit 2 n=1 Tax=Puma concolor TaxID=9696 RepID=A0A6P6HGI5_PUMCO|nr:integrator complex subunit 2 [Puma concolor]
MKVLGAGSTVIMAECTSLQFVSPFAFEAMQKVDVVRLASLSDPELRLLLPCLVRMALCAPADQSQSWAQDKKLILRLLSGVEAVNSIVALLSVDFHALEQDASKEQQLRHKLGGGSGESILVSQLQHGLTLEFEHSDSPRRLRLVLSELLAIMNKVSESSGEFFFKSSELFESPVYLEEAADVLCILQAELPSLLPIVDVAEALLHVRNGAWFLCLLVANVPDSFNEAPNTQTHWAPSPHQLPPQCGPTEEEAEQLLQLMTSRPPATPAGVRFVSLSFCMLLAFSTLVSTPEQEQLMVVWLSWMIKEEAYFESTSGVSASFGEMLLLVAMYFHSNQLSAIIDLVCSTLGMKIVIKPSSLSRMKTIFTQEIFTEQVVTAHAVRVPVTSNLSANITGFLPIHCIYQLLRSRSFTKHKVSIKDWIYRQLCETSTPLHPQLLPLIDVYINSILTPASKSNPEATNQPVTEQEILSIFQGVIGGDNIRLNQRFSITAQLLVLYYILSYEEALLANTKTLAAMQRKPKSYSSSLMDQIPIKFLIRQAQGLQQELGGLHSALLRLLATNYPHLCIVDDWICEEEITGTDALLRRMLLTNNAKNHSPKQLQEAFSAVPVSHTQVMQILEHLTLLSASELIPYAEVLTSNMNQLLNSGVPRRILQTVNKLWMVLNTVMPRRLWVMTVNALQPSVKFVRQQKYTQNDLMIDPLIVLRCDQRVHRCPPLMDITLHMLNGYLLASKAYLSAHLKETAEQDRPSQNNTIGLVGQTDGPEVTREELKNALLAAQDSAAVQILLEICLPTEEEKAKGVNPDSLLRNVQSVITTSASNKGMEEGEDNLLCNLREVQCLICCLLHQMYIADPNIAKLVHFQGYPCELLPLTVAGIPSMHICLDFIPELIAQPELEKQIFAIQLLSHLCIQYALPKSLSVARLAVNVMGTLLTVLTQAKRYAFFMPTLPSLVSFCRAFPPLYEDIMSLLIQIGQVCASDVATQTRDIDPIITRLQQIKEKPSGWSGICKDPSYKNGSGDTGSMDPDVQLCHCIESTIIEIINMSVSGI